MDFLPKDYEVPSVSNYMKLKKGKNKFRVLGAAITGNEFWKNGKPVRKRPNETIQASEMDADSNLRHFWAFPVYNYDEQRIQILEITQKTIMSAIRSITKDEDWGDPKGFDIVITRDGDGFDTTYSVIPSPHKPLDEKIQKDYKNMTIDLEALFDGKDPFAGEDEKQLKNVKEVLGE